MPPEPIELTTPAAMDRAALVALLGERLELDVGRPVVRDRTLLDSADGRLRRAGLRAERSAGRGRAPLELHEPGAPVRRADVKAGRRHLVADLPPGPVRERLAPVLGPRALLPRVRVRGEVQPLSVLDGEAKSVVRIAVEHPVLVASGGERVTLAPRVSLRPVLGYDRAFERTLRVLRDELGLAEADRPLYDEAVKAGGGRPGGLRTKVRVQLEAGTRTDAAAGLVLRKLLKVAEANVEGAAADVDPDFLHDLRVSIRRARSVLRELRDVHDPQRRAHLREELRWAQELTGPVRDLDVQLLEWPDLEEAVGRDRSVELEPLRAMLARRRARELTAMRRGLRSARFAAMLSAWRELAQGRPPADGDGELAGAARPIAETAGARIATVHRRMVRDGRRIDDDSRPEALHDLRKRGKELRYLLELFGSAFPAAVVDPTIAELKRLQEILGRFQDRSVQIEALHGHRHELAAEPDGPAALIALGPALEVLRADQAAARAEFAERFAGFSAKAQRKRIRGAFAAAAR